MAKKTARKRVIALALKYVDVLLLDDGTSPMMWPPVVVLRSGEGVNFINLSKFADVTVHSNGLTSAPKVPKGKEARAERSSSKGSYSVTLGTRLKKKTLKKKGAEPAQVRVMGIFDDPRIIIL